MMNHRNPSQPARRLALLVPLLLVPGTGGCAFLQARDPKDLPPKVKEPTGWPFNPEDGKPTNWTPMNDPAKADLPDAFVVPANGILSGDTISIQSVAGNRFGPSADPVRLAGIIAPKPGQPGWAESVAAVRGWVGGGQRVTVYQDPVFPAGVDGLRMVSVEFPGSEKGPAAGKPLVLNRMLVRSGYAIVDLYSPSSLNNQTWLHDEAYARHQKLGLWKFPHVFAQLQQRVPVVGATNNKTKVIVAPVGATPPPPADAPAAPAPASAGP